MAILANFPLSYNDQVDIIEIFDGLRQRLNDAAHSSQVPTPKPISYPTDSPDHGFLTE